MKIEIFVGLPKTVQRDKVYNTDKGYVDPALVLKYVSEKSGLSLEKLVAKTRKDDILKWRQAYVWLYRSVLLRKGYIESLNVRTGTRIFNKQYATTEQVMTLIGKNYSTATNSVVSFENRLRTDKELKELTNNMLEELDKMMV